MKTAEEWRLEYIAKKYQVVRELKFSDDSFVRAIQLDAMRAGMTIAASQLDYVSGAFDESVVYEFRNSKVAEILSARDNLTQLPTP
jgi:hypothetical protein